VSVGYNDYLAGKFGPLPDDAESLRRGLEKALRLIGSYELDCRAIRDYVTPANMGRGFCQGEVYELGVEDIFASMEKVSA
jgi:hypothetical protein